MLGLVDPLMDVRQILSLPYTSTCSLLLRPGWERGAVYMPR